VQEDSVHVEVFGFGLFGFGSFRIGVGRILKLVNSVVFIVVNIG
jgi:hypothetical protein